MKHMLKKTFALAAGLAAGVVLADTGLPVVSSCTMQQGPGSRVVTIKYAITDNIPAVVTLDVKTNLTGSATANESDWVSIGGEHIWNAAGAVWRKVTSADLGGDGKYTITWDPSESWTGESGKGFRVDVARVEVTAWPLDNTPDYMVVDISGVPANDVARYYPAVDFLPHSSLGQPGAAVTNNPAYKTTKLLMRKIMAKGVEWTMGSTTLETGRQAEREATHLVSLTNNFYIGVFEVTQKQWELVATNSTQKAGFSVTDADMRPMDSVSYNEIRLKANSGAAATSSEISDYSWPKPPFRSSFLGLLRLRTGGLDFDLPSDAQWEFAARAGNGDQRWGDGSAYAPNSAGKDANLDKLGRYQNNGGKLYKNSAWANPAETCGATNGTAIVGTYAPNNWGLYDVHGNVWEWCLDWYENNIGDHHGLVNIKFDNPAQTRGGATGGNRSAHGGSWYDAASGQRPARRLQWAATTRTNTGGLRVVCTAGLR